MAYSKLSTPRLGTPQHILECSIEECERNCQYYWNSFHQQMCEECQDEHLKIPEYRSHEMGLNKQRKWPLSEEKCKSHPTKELVMLCGECQLPLCYKCATQISHEGHAFIDLETLHAENMALYFREVSKIIEDFLPTAQKLHEEIKYDATQIKKTMGNLRTEMKAEGESLKSMVDTVMSENIQQVDNIEQTLLGKVNSLDTTFQGYISYLNDLVKEYQGRLSSPKLRNLTPDLSEKIQEIKQIPERTKFATPVFTTGQYCTIDVEHLLGKINAHESKAEPRHTPPIQTKRKLTSKKKTGDRQKKSDLKQTIPLPYSNTRVGTFNVPVAGPACHISLDKFGIFWVNDCEGNIVQTDPQGNQLQKIKSSGSSGCHTISQNGNLIFTKDKTRLINIILGNNVTELIKTGDWEPISTHSSHINGGILVGMVKNGEAKIIRYNKTGNKLQNMQREIPKTVHLPVVYHGKY